MTNARRKEDEDQRCIEAVLLLRRGNRLLRQGPEKQKIQIKFSHTRAKTLQIKNIASEEKRQQINSLVKSLNKLREQMLARTNI